MRRRLAAVVVLALSATRATAVSPTALLADVARNERFPAPTRADVRIERRADGATTTGDAVVLGRGHTLYVETRDGTRALVRPGKIVVRTGWRVARAARGARLGGTDLLLEDLVPFTPGYFRLPQVSDEGPTGTVVTGAPAMPSTRALVVVTIDPDAATVTRVKCYEGSISDLATFRRDDDFVDVDGHARPTRIAVDRPRDGGTTRLAVVWRAAPDVPPTAFRLAALRGPSPVAR